MMISREREAGGLIDHLVARASFSRDSFVAPGSMTCSRLGRSPRPRAPLSPKVLVDPPILYRLRFSLAACRLSDLTDKKKKQERHRFFSLSFAATGELTPALRNRRYPQ